MSDDAADTSNAASDGFQDDVTTGDGTQAAVPAAGVINQTMPLEVVAQQESTRSYFLAQTLESTKTVPIVSANLPLDKGPQAGADGGTTVGSEDKVTDGDPSVSAEGEGGSEPEGGDDSDESDLGASDEAVTVPGVSSESTVVGSFIYRGITYAVEPGGESVAVVAADYAKLPGEFIEAQTIVLPSMVTVDGADYYTVSRIADHAFADINGSVAVAARAGQGGVALESSENDGATDDATPESPEGDDGVGDEADDAATDVVIDATVGITAITVPASIVEIGDDAFTNCDTLQYVIVSEDNPNYSMYDGCLYDADQQSLLLIPGGRLGAVRVPRVTASIPEDAFSHCAHLTTLIVDADSAASQLLQENDLYNAKNNQISVLTEEEALERGIAASDARLKEKLDGLADLVYRDIQNDVFALGEGFEGRAAYALNAVSNTTVYYRGTIYFYSSGTGSANCTTGNYYYGSLSAAPTSIQRQKGGSSKGYDGLTLISSWGGSWGSLYSIPKLDWDSYVGGIQTVQYMTGGMSVPKELPFGNTSTPSFLKLWINDYWYSQNLGAWFIADANRYLSPYMKTQAGVESASTGTFSDGTTEKCQVAGGTAGTNTSAPTGNFTIEYPESPTADDQTKVFKGWCSKPDPGVSGAQWFYIAPGFRDTVENYETVTTYNKAITLYAIYEDGYTITLDDVKPEATGGDGSFAALNSELPVQASVSVPVCGDYEFRGYYELREDGTRNFWYDKSGKLIEPSEGTFSEDAHEYWLKSNVTLYAEWGKDIVLDARGGQSDQTAYVIWDTALPQKASVSNSTLSAPTREGYLFNGFWSTEFDESDPDSNQYYIEDPGDSRYVVPVESKIWDIDQDRLYAHWKYKIVLDTNVFDSDEQSALKLSDIELDMGDSVDDYGNVYTVVMSPLSDGDDETLSILAIDGAPIKLPTVSGRTGYESTQAWGVTHKSCGQAADLFTLVNGYTSKNGTAVDIKEANEAFALAPGSDGVNTATLYADWTSEAKSYNVTLRSAYVFDAENDFRSDADRTIKAVYDQPLLIEGDPNITPSITAPVYGAASKPTNLVFLGYATEQNGAYTAHGGTLYNGQLLISSADDDARTPQTATDRSTNGVADFRLTDADGPIVLYALWGYPEVSIKFDLQDPHLTDEALGSPVAGNVTDQGGGIYAETLITNDPMPDARNVVAAHKNGRPGFTFKGFWNTRYAEQGAQAADTSGIEPVQYYAADGTCLYDPNGDGTSTWDMTHGITLYAHWEYTVFLNLNAFNTDGEIVLADNAATDKSFGAQVSDIEAALKATEQSVMNLADGTFSYPNTVVQGATAAGAQSVAVTKQSFTAIDGAPIQLPQATGRTGYAATSAWGTEPDAFGTVKSASRVPLNGQGVSDPFRAQLVDVSGAGSSARGYVLYADWTDKAQKYMVNIVNSYVNEDGDAVVGTPAATTLKAVYDQPLLIEGNADITPSLAAPRYDGAGSVDGTPATRENLVFKGYYTLMNGFQMVDGSEVNTERGIKYIDAVTDDSGTVTGTATATDPTAGAQGRLMRLRETGSSEAPTTVTLYALWGYPGVTISFDLQGGNIAGDTNAFAVNAQTGADMAKLLTSVNGVNKAGVPQRAGYYFGGWWTTEYDESDPSARYYFGENDADDNTAMDAAKPTWDRYATATTLYAHWKYVLDFTTTLENTSDIADVSVAVLRPDNDAARTSGTVGLSVTAPSAAAYADAPEGATITVDAFGNRTISFAENFEGTNAEVNKVRIECIAGAPVQLPSAQDRRQKMNADYELVGYYPTWTWENVTKTRIAYADETNHVTALDDSWTNGYGGEGSLPCKLGARDAATGEAAADKLSAVWTPMEYRVDVNYSYTADDGTVFSVYEADAAEGAAPTTRVDSMLVTYDDADYAYTADRTGVVPDPLAAADGTGAHARAVADDGTVNDNLDFGGIRTAANGIRDNGTAASALAGTEYWNRAGKLQVPQFRAIYGPDVKVYNTTDRPFSMYVLWQQPTRPAAFDLYLTDDWSDEANMSTVEVDLMKGDAVDKSEASSALHDLANELYDAMEPGAARENYVFGGFWTTPWSETEAQNVGGRMVEPVCYYVLGDDGALRAADPTVDTWAANVASGVWREDGSTTLYAHWKYKVTFAMDDDDVIPNTSARDLLLIGNATEDRYAEATASAVPFESLDAAKHADDATKSYVDARGYVTYGAPLVLPVNQGSTGIDATAITRIRDFSAANGYGFSGRGKTGYVFAGWMRDGAAVEGVDATSGVASHVDLRPGANATVALKAAWQAVPFTLTLQNYPDYLNQYANLITSHSVADAGTRTITVLYDSPIGEGGATDAAFIDPPSLYGFTFRGYYGSSAGAVDEQNANAPVSNAGVQFYSEPVADAANAYFGKSPANATAAWFVPNPTIVSAPGTEVGVRGQAQLFAYYTRNGYTMTFLPREEGDGTVQATTGKVGGSAAANPYRQTWHYGDVLAPVVAGTVEAGYQAPGSTDRSAGMPQAGRDTFYRQGYDFDGWYFYPQGADHVKENRVYVYRCDSRDASAAVSQPGIWTWDAGSGAWTKRTMTTWRTTDLFDAESDVTFYAGWTPKTYTVTFHPQINRNGDTSANNAYLNDPRTFVYEQLLTADDLPQIAGANAPFEFVGWNRGSTAEPGDISGWLFAKNAENYDGTRADTTEVYALMPVEGGYLFMPEGDTTVFTYFGIWGELADRHVVLFSGDHGTLSAPGSSATQDFMVRSFNYYDGFDLDALEGNGISRRSDTGYEFTGWAEVSPEALGLAAADSYAGLNSDSVAAAEAKAASVLDAVRAYYGTYQDDWGATRFPSKLNTYNYTGSYRNVYTGERGLPYRDYYLIATYKIIDDYEITLDLGDTATYGEQINGAEVGARIENDPLFAAREVADGRIRYRSSFTVNIGPSITLPQPVSSKYAFAGWQEVVDGEPVGDPQPDLVIDVERYAEEAAAAHARAKRTYRAVWTEKEFVLRFQQDHYADTSHTSKLEGEDFEYIVKYSDTVKVPWPATRGTGHVFQYWSLLNLRQYERDVAAARAEAEANGTDVEAAIAAVAKTYGVGEFTAEQSFKMSDLLYAMGNPAYSLNGYSLFNAGVENGNVITFNATWSGDHINAVLPVSSVSVKVDPERGDILTADGLQLSVQYPTQYAGRQVEVVSLRYDKLDANGVHVGDAGSAADGLFGSVLDKVYLSLYADMVPAESDTSRLFAKENVNDDGTLRGGLAADSTNTPLLIDLAHDTVIAKAYPYGDDAASSAGASYGTGGIYDGSRRLSDYGFRAFDQSAPLPLRYSLLFKGDSLAEFVSKLPAQESNQEIPIAHMYYTIRLVPQP